MLPATVTGHRQHFESAVSSILGEFLIFLGAVGGGAGNISKD
jgi:hypothetical protein